MTIPAFIREQPAALDRCLAAVAAFRERVGAHWPSEPFSGIALVGSGSSFNALTAIRPAFVASRRGPVTVHEPEDFIAELAWATTRPLVLVLSQSGASSTSIAAARAAAAAGLATIAITAAPGGPLATTGATLLELPVGDEPVGPKTKGFVGSLAMLLGLAEALGAATGKPLTGAALAPLIEPARQWAEALVPSLGAVDQLIVAGRGAAHGIALEASLKIAEMAGIPTAAFATEELLHGRLHGMTTHSVALLLTDSAAERAEAQRVGQVMASRGCRVISVAAPGVEGTAEPSPWHALRLVVPFQWLAVRLAEVRGLVPQVMRHGALSAELAIKTGPAIQSGQAA